MCCELGFTRGYCREFVNITSLLKALSELSESPMIKEKAINLLSKNPESSEILKIETYKIFTTINDINFKNSVLQQCIDIKAVSCIEAAELALLVMNNKSLMEKYLRAGIESGCLVEAAEFILLNSGKKSRALRLLNMSLEQGLSIVEYWVAAILFMDYFNAEEKASQCLESAVKSVDDVWDICFIADAFVKIVHNQKQARLLLKKAESMIFNIDDIMEICLLAADNTAAFGMKELKKYLKMLESSLQAKNSTCDKIQLEMLAEKLQDLMNSNSSDKRKV